MLDGFALWHLIAWELNVFIFILKGTALYTGAIADLHSGTELIYKSTWTTAALPSGIY